MFDRFRAFSQGRQVLLVSAGIGLIGALLTAVWFLFFHTSYEPLFSELHTTDAATIVADLDKRKIPYRLANGGTTILVPEDMVDATRLNVMSEDLPLKGTVGFELFNKSDMGLTDFAQKINYQRALQGELARTIMTLDGVEMARVHLSLGEDRIFRDDQIPPKASVTIRMKKGATLSANVAQGLRRLVAAAVPNLDIANVVVLDEEGDVVSTAPQITAVSETGSPAVQEKQAIEQYYESRIREALTRNRLADNVGVSVWADVAVEAASGEASAANLSSWTPANRTFPLQVTLSPATALVPASEDMVRTAVAVAVASNTAQDDVVSFGVASRPVSRVARDDVSSPYVEPHEPVPAFAPLPEDDRGWIWELGFAGLLLVVILVGPLLLLRKLRAPRRLSERARANFAAKLRTALEPREGQVASRS